jgi:hypothetical protein
MTDMNSASALLVFFGAALVASDAGARLLLNEADLPCFLARVWRADSSGQQCISLSESLDLRHETHLVIYEIDLDLATSQKSPIKPFLGPFRLLFGLVSDESEPAFGYELDIGKCGV